MVQFFEKVIYCCPYCDYFDEDEDDVYEHRKEHLEKIEEKYEDVYVCEICKCEYKRNKPAEQCEEKHKNNNDKIYQTYLHQEEMSKLIIEGNKPNQKKLLIK